METRSDVGILKDIYEAERRADRIVREAEAEAMAVVADADAAARSDTERRREEQARLAAEALRGQIAEIDAELRTFLAAREAETDRWVRARREGVGRVVDRLTAMVLPP